MRPSAGDARPGRCACGGGAVWRSCRASTRPESGSRWGNGQGSGFLEFPWHPRPGGLGGCGRWGRDAFVRMGRHSAALSGRLRHGFACRVGVVQGPRSGREPRPFPCGPGHLYGRLRISNVRGAKTKPWTDVTAVQGLVQPLRSGSAWELTRSSLRPVGCWAGDRGPRVARLRMYWPAVLV